VFFAVTVVACDRAHHPLRKAQHAPGARDAPKSRDAGGRTVPEAADAAAPTHDGEDAGESPGTSADAGRTHDAGVAHEIAQRTDDEECRPYTPDRIDFSGYTSDFTGYAESWPDVVLIWRAPETRLIRPVVESDNDLAEVLRADGCTGRLPFPQTGNGGVDLLLQVEAGTSYMLVIKAPRGTRWVRLSMEPACTDKDATCMYPDGADGLMCGVWFDTGDGPDCLELHAPGEIDARCPDTDWNGERVEGCCQPDGTCGHFDAKLGCHDHAHYYWQKEFYCDERAIPDPPAVFNCGLPDDACTSDEDCCHTENNQGSCPDGFCAYNN
jgi:hypothetical protein